MDLRDRFAVHFAAALVDVFPEAEVIAKRAYDLADALLAERARRIDEDEARALAAPPSYHAALLDEPMPGWEEPEDASWLEPPYDPRWDLDDVRWSGSGSRPPGPGLARTQPEEAAPEVGEKTG